MNEWHINVQHIFLINFYIEHFLFRVTVWEILILQVLNIFSNLQKNRKEAETFLTQVEASLGD
jgi:hypothetical protein